MKGRRPEEAPERSAEGKQATGEWRSFASAGRRLDTVYSFEYRIKRRSRACRAELLLLLDGLKSTGSSKREPFCCSCSSCCCARAPPLRVDRWDGSATLKPATSTLVRPRMLLTVSLNEQLLTLLICHRRIDGVTPLVPESGPRRRSWAFYACGRLPLASSLVRAVVLKESALAACFKRGRRQAEADLPSSLLHDHVDLDLPGRRARQPDRPMQFPSSRPKRGRPTRLPAESRRPEPS